MEVESKFIAKDNDDDDKSAKTSWQKVKRCVQISSFGQYRTPLYFEGKNSYASTPTGLGSLVFVGVMLFVTIMTMIPILEREKWNLDKRAIEITRFGTVQDKEVILPCEDCIDFTLEDALWVLNGTKYMIFTPDLPFGTTCLRYNFTLKFIKSEQEIGILPDADFPDFGYCFFTFLADTIISKVPSYQLKQPSILTVNPPRDPPYQLFLFSFNINNLTPNSTVVKYYRQPDISEVGLFKYQESMEYYFPLNAQFKENLNIVLFQQYDSVVPRFMLGSPKKELLFQYRSLERLQLNVNKTEIFLSMPQVLSHYVTSPNSLGQGLVQIGGIFAILKLSLLLFFFINKFYFEKRLKATMIQATAKQNYRNNNIQSSLDLGQELISSAQQQQSENISERYSIENFDRILQENLEMKESISGLRERLHKQEQDMVQMRSQINLIMSKLQ